MIGVWALLAGCGGAPHWPDTRPTAACAPGAFPADHYVVDVPRPDRTRRALAWVPDGEGPFDVVVNLHEFRSDPMRQQHYSGWFPFHEEADVLLLAPDGKSATWNAGSCCGKAHDKGIDDVAFLDDLIARVDAIGCTTGRVLVTGIGNGGMMAEHWACESDVPDAVVSVGGSLQTQACRRTEPIPVLHYHGEKDDFVPMDGSPGRLPGGLPDGATRPWSHARQVWQARNRTRATTSLEAGALTCQVGTGAAPTTFCTVADATDTWPGAANAPVASDHPLADATRGAWAWVQAAWARTRAASPGSSSEMPSSPPAEEAPAVP